MMKRFLTVLLIIVAVVLPSSAYSQIIRDAELGQPYTFEDKAEITLLDFSFVNEIAAQVMSPKVHTMKISSQSDQEIALLKVDITNLRTEMCRFAMTPTFEMTRFGHTQPDVTLSVVTLYKGKFSYNGSVVQYSPWRAGHLFYFSYRFDSELPCFVGISPMYSDKFAFFCRVPKRVANDKNSPLQMILKIGDDELTYNIRK